MEFVQKEVAHAFINEVGDRQMKQHLMGGDRSLSDALNHVLNLEAAKATAGTPARLTMKQVRVIADAAADRWDRAALRRKQLADDVRQILQEVEAGQRPEWKDILTVAPSTNVTVPSGTLVVRDGVLECHWESANGRTKTAQIVLPRSKVKCWKNSIEDLREDAMGSAGHLTRSSSSTTGYT
jgi:hypothetical protein